MPSRTTWKYFYPKVISADVRAALQLKLNALAVEDKLSNSSKAVRSPPMFFFCSKCICLQPLIWNYLSVKQQAWSWSNGWWTMVLQNGILTFLSCSNYTRLLQETPSHSPTPLDLVFLKLQGFRWIKYYMFHYTHQDRGCFEKIK